MNIVVLAGGLSPERDVSLSSGAKACAALRERGHRAVLVDLFLGLPALPDPVSDAFSNAVPVPAHAVGAVAPDLAAVRASRSTGVSDVIGANVLELCRAADIVYLALHGDDGENGRLQSLFDLLNIKYTGSGYFGCSVAMHKWVTKRLLLGARVRTPRGVLLQKHDRAYELGALALPVVVKPCCGGSSIGISIARSDEELTQALATAFSYEDEVLVEEYIEGRELSCGMLGGEALPVIEILPRRGFYDYANKYQPGWTTEITPAPLPADVTKRVQRAALDACAALGLEVYARVDFLLTQTDELYCLEANTLPGMTPTSLLPQEAAAVGVDYPTLCDRIVQLSMRKYRL